MRKGILSVNVFLMLIVFASFLFPAGQAADQLINNIEAFTRLYGYVKYFYPGDEAAETDWDKFAVYGAKIVEKAKNPSQLKNALEELFLPIAPALVIHNSKQKVKFAIASFTPPKSEGLKPVFWQHLGLGFGDEKSCYKSIRVNRKYTSKILNPFLGVTNSIDAELYRGKEIKMKAAVKVAEGKAQLWLRVDKTDRKMGFFNNMNDRPIDSNQWNYYEITGPVAENASSIYFGCFMRNLGKIWIDDFQMFVKEGDQWKPITLKNPDFEDDKEGDLPKQWTTNSEGKNMQVTTESALKGVKSICLRLAPGIPEMPVPLFEAKPGFGEYIVKELGAGLSLTMPIVLYGTETQTYPASSKEKLEKLKADVEKEVPGILSGDDLYVRLGDIVNCWNVFQHFYPYFDIVKTDWNASLTEAFNRAYSDKTKFDFLLTLKKLIADLKDGHGNVNLKDPSAVRYRAPIQFGWIEGKLVITNIYDPSVTIVKIGDIVTDVDGVKAKDALDEKIKYISGATEGWKIYNALFALISGPKDSELALKIDRDGLSLSASLRYTAAPMEYYNYKNSKDVSKKIEEGIYYLDMGNISMEEIDKLMPELEKAKSIICDLRGYPKDTIPFISHLLKEKDTTKDWMRIPRIIYPDFEKVTYKNLGWELEPLKPHLNAKIIFITDGRAISYAESYMGFIEGYKLATIVGQPTAGTNGNVNPFTLPGEYSVTWTGMWVVKHDGSQHHGVGIIPHVRVERTIKGFREGRDEFLEKAIEIAKQ